MRESIKLDSDKYEVVLVDNGREFKALRYEKEWRDLTGDSLILSMFYRIQELKEENKELQDELGNLSLKKQNEKIGENFNIEISKPRSHNFISNTNYIAKNFNLECDIDFIKNNTKLCDTFCCYEDCENCVSKYIEHLNKLY